MNEEDIKKEGLRGIKEFEMAWEEFFKDKPKPKSDEEDRKQQEEFYHWYNYVRKQSDTGKTPAEMYKEIYGKEPPEDFPKNSQEPSRFMNFEWDEDYNEDDFNEEDKEECELDDAEEEGVSIANEIFDENWKKIKQEVEGQSKREACKYSFILGFLNYMRMMNKKAELIEKEMKNMSKEDTEKFIKKLQEERGGE